MGNDCSRRRKKSKPPEGGALHPRAPWDRIAGMETWIEFAKMHGAGNDFVVVADPGGLFRGGDGERLARALCTPHTGLGSEGLIALAPESGGETDFSMVFRNPDGSRVGMCGNGARCAAFFAFRRGWAGRKTRFRSDAGTVGAEIASVGPDGASAVVRVDATEIRDRRGRVAVTGLPGREFRALDTGVPHAVRFVDGAAEDFDALDVVSEGRTVRYAPEFAPAGTNADFARVDGPSELSLRTYERGVEDETGACGTGAIAAAVAAAESGLVSLPCRVKVRGGDTLVVDAVRGADGLCRAPTLSGPARLVCEGRFRAEWIA